MKCECWLLRKAWEWMTMAGNGYDYLETKKELWIELWRRFEICYNVRL